MSRLALFPLCTQPKGCSQATDRLLVCAWVAHPNLCVYSVCLALVAVSKGTHYRPHFMAEEIHD